MLLRVSYSGVWYGVVQNLLTTCIPCNLAAGPGKGQSSALVHINCFCDATAGPGKRQSSPLVNFNNSFCDATCVIALPIEWKPYFVSTMLELALFCFTLHRPKMTCRTMVKTKQNCSRSIHTQQHEIPSFNYQPGCCSNSLSYMLIFQSSARQQSIFITKRRTLKFGSHRRVNSTGMTCVVFCRLWRPKQHPM